MKKLLYLAICIPFIAIAQDKGIKFEQNLTWEEIIGKAKAKNKFVFVDCYATWCGPCKFMDKDIYPKDSVGGYMNDHFISVKMQMDSSTQDSEDIKQMYSTAHYIQEKYGINTYPTYLFLSPVGEIVHRGLGAKQIGDFLSLAANAVDTNFQFYTLLNAYQSHKKNYTIMPYLAKQARAFHDIKLSEEIAYDYMRNYVEKSDNKDIFTKEIFDFIGLFYRLIKYKDKIFKLYLDNPDKIDSVMNNKGYARRYVDYVIYHEEIAPKINDPEINESEPRWSKISHAIRMKYGKDYVCKNILQAKVEWYEYKKKWKGYTKYLVKQVEQKGIENTQPNFFGKLYLNNSAFEIFKYSSNKRELKKALTWINLALSMSSEPYFYGMDTKANILYKLGRKADGIALESKAASLAPKNKDIQNAFEKMKNGLPTWPTEL